MPKPSPSSRLEALRGTAPKQSTNVRALARFAANSRCPTARLAFAARVDLDRLLAGTDHQAPFGQSPFAFRRGNRFEELLRKDKHKPILTLLEEQLSYSTEGAVVVARPQGRPTPTILAQRARTTAEHIEAIVKHEHGAPNLIDGAVLARDIGGMTSYFEADAVAASFAEPIYAGEIKSFPTVDGQADPEKVGAAIAQVSIYILLLRELVERVGGDSDRVSTDALLITAKNTGLQPTMTVKSVGREVDRAARLLDAIPSTDELVDDVPANAPSFDEIRQASGRTEVERLDRAEALIEGVGNDYQPGCLATCGFSKLCRARAARRGELVRIGGQFGRTLPGIETIDRVGELAAGAKPKPDEQAAAERLRQAQRLVDEFARPKPRKTSTRRSK